MDARWYDVRLESEAHLRRAIGDARYPKGMQVDAEAELLRRREGGARLTAMPSPPPSPSPAPQPPPMPPKPAAKKTTRKETTTMKNPRNDQDARSKLLATLPAKAREKARSLSLAELREVCASVSRATSKRDEDREQLRARMGLPTSTPKVTREGNKGVFRTMTQDEARAHLAQKGM